MSSTWRKSLLATAKICLAAALAWAGAALSFVLGANRPTASMLLLLVVLGVSTRGEWTLAILTSIAASLAFSWYYVDKVGSLAITTWEGAVTFSMMVITALTASQLSVRAQRRAAEAIRRREEMEQLQKLGNSLLLADTVAEAAARAVPLVMDLFAVSGAMLDFRDGTRPTSSGVCAGVPQAMVSIGRGNLELYGAPLSTEVSSAIGNLIRLVLERARSGEARARLEAAQRGEELRNVVLNAMAHNFKTPLTSIKAAASILRNSPKIVDRDAKELVAAIDEEADRLDQLIRESLDLARIEAHQASPRFEACSMSEVATAVTARLERYIAGRQVTLDVPESLPSVRGDRFLLGQMIMQVVDNAWKYSKPGSEIRISGDLVQSNVILTVENDGIEIPADQREKLFTKFYRGTGNGMQVEGTGMGLAIARAIAEVHGGRVWLDTLPRGPAFRFSLPIEPAGGVRR